MAKDEKDPLVNCPFGCGSMVRQSKVGESHTYRVYDPISREYVNKRCG